MIIRVGGTGVATLIAAAVLLTPLTPALAQTGARSLAATSPQSKKIKRPKKVPRGFGFLPGYVPPLPNSIPVAHGYGQRFTGSRYPRFWYYDQAYYGYGSPRYYRGRWNGGSFGPCYTQTPIGPVWNCGR